MDAHGIPALLAVSVRTAVAGLLFLIAGGFHYAMLIAGTLVGLGTYLFLRDGGARR